MLKTMSLTFIHHEEVYNAIYEIAAVLNFLCWHFLSFKLFGVFLSPAKAQSLICIVLMMRSILLKERKISIKPWDVRNCIIKNEKVYRHHMMMTWESINKSSVCEYVENFHIQWYSRMSERDGFAGKSVQ